MGRFAFVCALGGALIVALALLSACGAEAPPQAASAIDLTEFWKVRR